MIAKIWRKAIGSDDKLPFTDHLDELRHRLIVSLVGVGLGFAVSYGFSQQLLLLLQRPMPTRLVFIAPTEAFLVNLKVAFYAGLFLSVPLLLFQVWKFVAPGLYEHERRYSFPFLIISTLLFLLGAIFAYLVILPIALHFLIAQGGELWQPNITLSNYLSFCMRLILAAGLGVRVSSVDVFPRQDRGGHAGIPRQESQVCRARRLCHRRHPDPTRRLQPGAAGGSPVSAL